MADITQPEYTTLRRHVTVGNDNDLPDAADKRSRVIFIDGRPLTPNATVTLRFHGLARVLGPSRGRRYFTAAWHDENDGQLCVGSFTAEDLA